MRVLNHHHIRKPWGACTVAIDESGGTCHYWVLPHSVEPTGVAGLLTVRTRISTGKNPHLNG
jgi:hypothetical protein